MRSEGRAVERAEAGKKKEEALSKTWSRGSMESKKSEWGSWINGKAEPIGHGWTRIHTDQNKAERPRPWFYSSVFIRVHPWL
jgi:hypothetical protein